MLDLLIINAQVIDGTGQPAFWGEVGIEGEKLAKVNRLPEDKRQNPSEAQSRAKEVIDAQGKSVCPGFIDLHTHSDRSVLTNPDTESSLLMGVTTEIGGNCGSSVAPMSKAMAERYQKRVEELEIDWRTLDDFFVKVQQQGLGNNHGLFVGQGSVRACVMGQETRFPTEPEIDRMAELISESMEMGAFGLSTGRAYTPGCHAGFREIVELTRVVGEHRGLYTSHIADQWANVHRATWEVLEIGMRTGAVPQVAHQKVVGKDNWGRSDEVLAILEQGQEMGVELMADVYPYPYSAVMSLERVLPAKLRGDSAQDTLDNLHSEGAEEEIRRAFREEPTYVSSRLSHYGVVQCSEIKDYEWLDVGEVATHLGTDLAGAVHHLLCENDLKVKIAGIMDEDDVRTIVAHPLVMIGSDSSIRSLTEDLKSDEDWPTVHPRQYGTFPRVLSKYVREEHLLTLEEAVYKMTGLPAEGIELDNRGILTRGFAADLVLFDPNTISDEATVDNPCAGPEGINYVLVNGQIAAKDGEVQDVRSGKVLRDTQGRMVY